MSFNHILNHGRDSFLNIRDQAQLCTDTLSKDLEFFVAKPFSYPVFAQFLRQGFLHPSNLVSPLIASEQRILNQYEYALARFWTAFPDSLHRHPLVKDLAFFLTCLFGIKDLKHQILFRSIWSRTYSISSTNKSPYSNLEYFAPGDYLSLLSARTKSQRFHLAVQLLTFFEQSLFSPETYPPSSENDIQLLLQIDINKFLVLFHNYVFSAPKNLTFNDLHLLSVIVSYQSVDQAQLAVECKLNKNTVSTRLKWLFSHHILYHRLLICYSAFKFTPYIVLAQTDSGVFPENKLSYLDPWLLSKIQGSEGRYIFYFLVPKDSNLNLNEFKDSFDGLTFKILSRDSKSTMFSYNVKLYDPTLNTWDFPDLPTESSPESSIIIHPFTEVSDKDHQITKQKLRVLNYFKDYPFSSQREACESLRIGTSTLSNILKSFQEFSIAKWIYGIYPFDLPIFASFFFQLSRMDELQSVFSKLTQYLPIAIGRGFTGDFQGLEIQIPFQNSEQIFHFIKLLDSTQSNLSWYQVNEQPFASRWRFPLHNWNSDTQSWIIH